MSPIDRRFVVSVNWPLLVLVLATFTVGVLNLYSASGFRMGDELSMQAFFSRQLLWGSCGLFAMLLVVLVDYKHLASAAWPLFFVTILLLLLVMVAGKSVSGARRWLEFGGITFQPSELAKFAVLILGAKLLAKRTEKLGWIELMAVVGIGMVPAFLVIVEPDLGTGLNILLLLFGALFWFVFSLIFQP
ncbi:MAG: FtsW/RodA/SpoVE family cell cycle protein [Desulfovibrio sp.]|nr:FtsW/RodA/SpoVE family cell cycle protein [Desulfovibrio sp.]